MPINTDSRKNQNNCNRGISGITGSTLNVNSWESQITYKSLGVGKSKQDSLNRLWSLMTSGEKPQLY
jgi:hypothetical protein